MSESSPAWLTLFRWTIAAVSGMVAVAVVVITYRWPVIGDAQVFHYVHFLMQHGFAPYRDIPDINMPGTYLIEDWAMRLFGGSDLAWHVYDLTLLGVLTLAMIVIARPYDWIAGLFAGVIFAIAHECEGPKNTAQRDQVMTVLIMIAYASLFEALRRRKPWMLFPAGLCLGLAMTVKPTVAPLAIVLLAMMVWSLRNNRQAVAPYVWTSLAGTALPGALVLVFLFSYHAFGDFFASLRSLTSFYAGLDHASTAAMLRHILPRGAVILLAFAIIAALLDKRWSNWERHVVHLGIGFGVFSYWVQGKGFLYHTYPLAAFVLLWASIELMVTMRTVRWSRAVGVAGMAAGLLVVVPTYYERLLPLAPRDVYTMTLESSLRRMGGDRLNGQIECLDLIDGCFNALYRLKIVESSGDIGDLILFAPERSPVVDQMRERFWQEISTRPPSVIVLSNEWFNRPRTFHKVDTWPQFAAYLEENYTPVVSEFGDSPEVPAYRIYVRKGVSLPAS